MYKQKILNLLNEVKHLVDMTKDEWVEYPILGSPLIKAADEVSEMLAETSTIPVLSEEEIATVHGELITVLPVKRQSLTDLRIQSSYSGGQLALHYRVYSVGVDAQDAIKNLGQKLGWGELDNFSLISVGDEFSWFHRFTADGTSMKAGGWFVPGGAIVSWWK